MARRSKRENPESLRKALIALLAEFETKLLEADLRRQVLALIPANHLLRDLGSSLIPDEEAHSAGDRILAYFRKHPSIILASEELMVVAGISEYARRIRELRVQHGWPIVSGQAVLDLINEDKALADQYAKTELKPDAYVLLEDVQDRDSAYRWNLANEIKKSKQSVKNKIISYLRKNVGKRVTGEELKYLAGDRSEWARRVRELRTEDGWPILSSVSGMEELPVGVYVLSEDKQAEVHDRKIPDLVRVEVLERDSFSCRKCLWRRDKKKAEDPRHLLELHHLEHHVAGGENTAKNLITLCNVCHDAVHKKSISESQLLALLD